MKKVIQLILEIIVLVCSSILAIGGLYIHNSYVVIVGAIGTAIMTCIIRED